MQAHARRRRRARGRGGDPAARDHAGRPGRAAARAARLVRAPPAVRALGGRHARACAGERPGAPARGPRRSGRGGARDPDRAAAGGGGRCRAARHRGLRARLRHEPERRRAAARRARARRPATHARSRARPSRPSGPGTAAELARRGVRADVVPERSVAEALVEALAGVEVEGRRVLVARASEARDVLPDALAERGAQVDRAAALRHGGGAARRGCARGGRARRLRHLHLQLHRALLHERDRRPLPDARRASSRSGRSRARPRASSGSRCTWRRSSTTSTASSPLCWRMRRDDHHAAHRLRAARRVRGRVPRRDPHDPPRRADRRRDARDRAARRSPRRDLAAQRAAVPARGRARGGGRSPGGHRAPRRRRPLRGRPRARRPRQRCVESRLGARRRRGRGHRRHALAAPPRAGFGHLPRARHLRARRRRRSPPERTSATPASRVDVDELVALELPAPLVADDGATAHVCSSTATATPAST